MRTTVSYPGRPSCWLWNVCPNRLLRFNSCVNRCGYRVSETCACTSASFQQAGRTCLQSNCSSLDQATAALLQENQCTTGTWLVLSFISWLLMRTIIAVASGTASPTTQIVPISTTLPNDALTVGYAIGNVGWVAVAGALSIIVAF